MKSEDAYERQLREAWSVVIRESFVQRRNEVGEFLWIEIDHPALIDLVAEIPADVGFRAVLEPSAAAVLKSNPGRS